MKLLTFGDRGMTINGKIFLILGVLAELLLGAEVTYPYTRFAFMRWNGEQYGDGDPKIVAQDGEAIVEFLSSTSIHVEAMNISYTLDNVERNYSATAQGDSVIYFTGRERKSGKMYMIASGASYINLVKVGAWKLCLMSGSAEAEGDETGVVFGSGFAVNQHTLVTNNHVVEGRSAFAISNKPTRKKYVAAEVIYRDPDLDLAVLHSDSILSPCLLDKAVYDIGEEIFVYGYPQVQSQGVSLKLTKGIISSKRGFKDDVKTYQIDAAVQHGNSGGPLVRNGKVVGVVSAMLEDSQNVNYAIKSNFVGAVLEVLGIKNVGKAAPKECTYFVIGASE